MSDNGEVLSAIGSLKELVEAKHKHLDEKIDGIAVDVRRHSKDIGELYGFDREQTRARTELEQKSSEADAQIREDIIPVINTAKAVKKGVWVMLTATLTAFGTTAFAWIRGAFAGSGG